MSILHFDRQLTSLALAKAGVPSSVAPKFALLLAPTAESSDYQLINDSTPAEEDLETGEKSMEGHEQRELRRKESYKALAGSHRGTFPHPDARKEKLSLWRAWSKHKGV